MGSDVLQRRYIKVYVISLILVMSLTADEEESLHACPYAKHGFTLPLGTLSSPELNSRGNQARYSMSISRPCPR